MRNKIVIALCICVPLLIVFVLLPMGCIFGWGKYLHDPPRPEITYGEFPFRIEYELQGERFVVEDTVICEFDGFGIGGIGSPKYCKWKSRLASGGKGNLLILGILDNTKRISLNVGVPEYYMGQMGISSDEYWHYNLKAFLREYTGSFDFVLFPEEWYDEYGFSFISWEFTDPIVNTFK